MTKSQYVFNKYAQVALPVKDAKVALPVEIANAKSDFAGYRNIGSFYTPNVYADRSSNSIRGGYADDKGNVMFGPVGHGVRPYQHNANTTIRSSQNNINRMVEGNVKNTTDIINMFGSDRKKIWYDDLKGQYDVKDGDKMPEKMYRKFKEPQYYIDENGERVNMGSGADTGIFYNKAGEPIVQVENNGNTFNRG